MRNWTQNCDFEKGADDSKPDDDDDKKEREVDFKMKVKTFIVPSFGNTYKVQKEAGASNKEGLICDFVPNGLLPSMWLIKREPAFNKEGPWNNQNLHQMHEI